MDQELTFVKRELAANTFWLWSYETITKSFTSRQTSCPSRQSTQGKWQVTRPTGLLRAESWDVQNPHSHTWETDRVMFLKKFSTKSWRSNRLASFKETVAAVSEKYGTSTYSRQKISCGRLVGCLHSIPEANVNCEQKLKITETAVYECPHLGERPQLLTGLLLLILQVSTSGHLVGQAFIDHQIYTFPHSHSFPPTVFPS